MAEPSADIQPEFLPSVGGFFVTTIEFGRDEFEGLPRIIRNVLESPTFPQTLMRSLQADLSKCTMRPPRAAVKCEVSKGFLDAAASEGKQVIARDWMHSDASSAWQDIQASKGGTFVQNNSLVFVGVAALGGTAGEYVAVKIGGTDRRVKQVLNQAASLDLFSYKYLRAGGGLVPTPGGPGLNVHAAVHIGDFFQLNGMGSIPAQGRDGWSIMMKLQTKF